MLTLLLLCLIFLAYKLYEIHIIHEFVFKRTLSSLVILFATYKIVINGKRKYLVMQSVVHTKDFEQSKWICIHIDLLHIRFTFLISKSCSIRIVTFNSTLTNTQIFLVNPFLVKLAWKISFKSLEKRKERKIGMNKKWGFPWGSSYFFILITPKKMSHWLKENANKKGNEIDRGLTIAFSHYGTIYHRV